MNLQVPGECRIMVHLRKDVDIVTASEALVGPMTAGHYFEGTKTAIPVHLREERGARGCGEGEMDWERQEGSRGLAARDRLSE